ncbi:MAG: class I SAM-dependent methyltransferase [Acidobacteriota bacterium]
MSIDFYQDARRYDLFEGKFASGNYLDFYVRQIERYGEPVLEVACGSGRLTIPLAEKGFDLKGLDISNDMLKLAEEKAKSRNIELDLVKGNMTDFDLDETFNLIFIPAQSLSHLYEVAEVEKCFACVKKHLNDDGRFLIELFNPSLEILLEKPDRVFPQANIGNIQVDSKSFYDSATQIKHIELIFREDDKKNNPILSFKMRQFFPQEIDALLKYNGFRIEKKFGDYLENDFNTDSQKQLIICQKI